MRTHHRSVVSVGHANLLFLDRVATARGTLGEGRSTDQQSSAGNGSLDGLPAGNAFHLHADAAHALAELRKKSTKLELQAHTREDNDKQESKIRLNRIRRTWGVAGAKAQAAATRQPATDALSILKSCKNMRGLIIIDQQARRARLLEIHSD